MFSEKSNIAFIGAGKVAYSLVSALLKAGYNVTSVISKNITSAKKLSEKFKITQHSNKLSSLNNKIKIFFLTVPDSQIKKTVAALSKLKLDFKNSLFIHVSGALDINELNSLKKKKAYTASFHIMQTFPSKKVVEIKSYPVTIEADKKAVKEFLKKLSYDLELKLSYIKSENKIYYHIAGVFASNFLSGNLFSSEKLFSLAKSGKNDFFSVYEPTVNSSLRNIKKLGPAKSLSGPVERGDYETIENHLKALKKKDKMLYMSYVIQSLNLLEVAKEKNKVLSKDQKKIKNLLRAYFR